MPAGASREGGPPAQGVNQQGGGLISENQSQSCGETIKDSVLAFVRWVNCSEVEIPCSTNVHWVGFGMTIGNGPFSYFPTGNNG